MKKSVNEIDAILSESLSGFAAAHGGLVTLGAENKFVRRARCTQQGRADLRRRQRSRAAACGVRRLRHAGRGLSRPGLHLPDARTRW